jgi:hypothetical protein
MRTEGKISKVAICEKCKRYILACHVDYVDKYTEKVFTKLSNDGFTIKTETGEESRSRGIATLSDCKKGICSKSEG